MKKSILALLFLFSTGIAFSQTTVTLQDQCNCEVLKGTDVSGSGATTPAGADLGDIYVNTNTGTIYFWDGDTWELTASDDQQLTGFTFNDATNTLSLTLENGGSVNVDLSSLSDTLTDSNTTVTSFGIDGTNTNLVITDSDSNTFAVALADLAALIDTDTQLTDAQVATAVNNEFPNLDTDSTDDFDGQWSSLTGVPADFADNVDNVDDADNDPANELQAITSTDGTVTVTPNGNDFDLSGFSGDFGDLSNVPANLDTDSTDDFSGDFNDLTNVPANLDTDSTDDFLGDFNDLTNVPANLDLDSTDDFDGQWSSLTGVPAGFADNIDNDTQLTDAQVATAVNNEFPNLDTDSTDDFSGDFGDLTNVPANLDLDSTDDFSGDFNDLTNVPANLDTDSTDDFSGDFGDLSNVPANLDLDSTDDFDGQWSSLTGVPADFADNVDNVDDADNDPANELQAITSTDGTVTVTPNGNDFDLSGFSGDFGDLSNIPANLDTDSTDDFSGDFNDLTNVPANLDTDSTDDFSGDFGDLTNVPANLDLDSTDDFDGQWSSLTGVPADFADNVDNVDDADNDPANELQAITSTDGTVTVTPNGNDFDLSGFSGDFGDLSNVPANLDTDSTDDFSGDFGDLTNVPANLDLDSTDDFDGQWSSLTGVPADFADNVDNVDDADSVVGNEYNTGSSITDGVLGITDGGGTEQVDLISNDANNNITFGSDGALYLNVASVSIAETITNLTDNNNGSVTYVNENGVSQTINKSAITDNLDGTYTFDNGDGSPITFIGTDNDTQLTDAQVATAVNNEFPNLDTDSTDDFSGDFGDLTNVPANLDLDSTDDFDGQWSSLTGVPADFADNVDNVDDADNDPANELQAITSTDGTVTVTPNGNDFDLSGFSGDFGDLSNVPANLDTDSTDDFSGDFGDLTNVPANLDLDSTDDFDGQWSSLTGIPADFADNVDNVDDADNDPANELQAITSTDGTVTVTPNGNDFDLSGFSGDFGDLSNIPANLDTDSTDDFDGQWSSLTGIPAGFADNIDNDTQLTDAQVATAVNNEFPNLDTDSTDDFDGQWSSLTGVPADFADNVDNVDDADNDPANELQAITSTDGTVTVTPNGNDFDLSGFSGDFGDLSNVPANLDTDSTDDFSGDFGDLTNVPANLDLDSTDDFDGQWSSLTGVPADFADNVDNVDDADSVVGNEYNTGSSITDGVLGITDGGGTEQVDLISNDANNNITFGSDGALYLNVASVSIAETITNLTDNNNGSVTYVNENGVSQTINKSAITDNLDGTYTFDNGDGSPITFIGTDNDTQLTDAQVATAVNNEFPNLDTDSTDDFSGDFGDLTNVPANLDLDSTDDFDGQWSSLTGVPADFADNVDNVDDADNDPANELQAITSTDGTVTVTPNGNDFDLSGFSGDFGDLSNVPANLDTDSTDDFSGDFGDLTNVPANLDLDSTDDFDGQWSSLTGVPAGFADNIDNDTQLTDAQVATAVNNEFPNLDTDSTDDFSGDFGDLTNVPANLDTDSTDDFDGQWSSLTGVPAGFADNIDNDTQLTDAQVATAVNNEFPNLDTDSTDDFDGQWSSLTGVPADFADNVDNVDDADNDPANELQAITSTDGTVTVTPNGNDFDLSGFSGDFGDLSNVPANLDTDSTDDFSGDFGDLTSVPANLDLDATDDFDGQWSSLTGVPADFADNVDNVDDADNDPANELQAITSSDGTVTVTPNGNDFDLSGFSGDFGDLSNIPANLDTDSTDDFSGDFNDLTNVPANLDTDSTDDFSGDFGDLTNVPANLDLDATDDFDGQWSSLTGVPAGFADNIDNDTQLTDAQVATAVNNEFPNLDTDSTDDFSGDFGDLTNVPANLDLDSTDDFDGQWSSLTGVPAGFADNIDNDTQLTDAQVATAVNNEFPNLDTDSTDDFSGDFGDLTNVPANLDLDSTDDFDGQWSSLTSVPADFADNVDNVDDADNDPANELQTITSTDGTVTVTPNGNDFDLSGFSGDFGDLSNVPANLDTDSTDDFSGDFGDLTNVPANLDLDATDDFDGQWSSLTGIPADFADNVDNVDDADNDPANELQAITSTDGTVTVTPNGNDFDLSGFSGDFGDLSNVPANLDTDSTDDFSGDFGDLTNVPANLDLDSTDDFDGQWSSLTGVPADFADNVDNVDDADNDPANELQTITSTDGTVTVTPNGNDFDLSGFSGDFGDLSNIPANLDTDSTDDFDGQWSSLTGVPAGFADNIDNDTQLTDAQVATAVNNEFPNLDTDSTDDFSGDFGDLTNVPANLDLDSTDDFDGQWSSLTGVPADFADNVDNVDDADNDPANELQAITSTDGTVTVTPNGNDFDLSGFSGDFGDLSNVPANLDTDSTDDFSGDFNDLTNVPANLDTDSTDDFSGDFGDLTNVPANLDLDATDDFDGQWSSLTGVPAGFADNIDNDTQLTDAQVATAVNNEFPNLDTDSTDDFSGDFGDLTNVPANLDLDSTDDFDGQWSSLTGIPADFADNVDNVDDADNDPSNELQAITSTDGTVTVTPNGNDFDLSGFSGDFGDLSNIPANLDTDSTDDFSGDFNDLTNVPANLDLDSTDDFDGQWSSLTGVPAGFADNIDNDTQLTDAQVATAVNNEFPNLDTDSTDDFSGDFGDLTNVPANLDLDATDDFDGQWSSLTGIPADFADNVDNVDDADASVTNEINTRFEVNGANLEIEDSNGTLQVALADIDTDDQTAAQVNSDSPVDVDGDGNTEATVEDVIQDIAPITSKAARIFYPPSIAIDASTNGTGRTVDLYAQYVAQYGTPAVSSAGAPTALPTYSAAELYYYVTYADPTVFDNMSIDANGVLTYDIIGQPADYNALINVVFVVR